MADKKVTQLTALTAPANTDLLLVVDDPAGSPISKKIEIEDLFGATSQTTFASIDLVTSNDTNLAANNFVFDATTDTTFTRGLIINEDGADSDTRIESDGSANAFFVDASTNRVGILCDDPQESFDVNADAIRIRTAQTPANSNNSILGWSVGTITWDANYIYVAANATHIVRASLASW